MFAFFNPRPPGPPKIVLEEAEELALFTYVVDNCGIKPPIPESLNTYNQRGCASQIPAIIQKYGKSSGYEMVVYRGQYDKDTITPDDKLKPFFSATKNPKYADTFASKLYDDDGEPIEDVIYCCTFKIHLVNVKILDLADISFDRVIANPPALVNTDDPKVPIVKKFTSFLGFEQEVLIEGGGFFHTSGQRTKLGVVPPPDIDVPNENFHQFHETWYGMIPSTKRPREGGRVRRTFKKHRLMSRKYCKKTPCRRMGFTQKASCRPYKNCYTRRR
jgi:hypothetical protein